LEDIMNMLHEKESKSLIPTPGIQLAPLSAMKRHAGKVINLFDENGNFIESAIPNASIFSYPRSMYGEQVQNPNKNKNEITKGIQIQKYMFDNIHDDKVFGLDLFSKPESGSVKIIRKSSAKVYGHTDG